MFWVRDSINPVYNMFIEETNELNCPKLLPYTVLKICRTSSHPDTFNFDLKSFTMVEWMDHKIGDPKPCSIPSSVDLTRVTQPAEDNSFMLANNKPGPSNLESNDSPPNDKNKVSFTWRVLQKLCPDHAFG